METSSVISRKITNLSLLPSISNAFTSIHRRTLNITFENGDYPERIFGKMVEKPNYDPKLLVANMIRSDLRVIDERLDILNKLDDDEKSIALSLNKVILHDPLKVSIRESFTNNFVALLLNKLDFNKYPLSVNIQPKYGFEAEGSKITSKPEFSVEMDDQIKIIFLDESRHLSNLKLATEFAECQIAAEMLSVAFTNYSAAQSESLLKDQLVFAIRVIGSRFTFYKCAVGRAYLNALGEGSFNDTHKIVVYRYPPNDHKETLFGFDYSNVNHREIIIKDLVSLREHVKKV